MLLDDYLDIFYQFWYVIIIVESRFNWLSLRDTHMRR